MNNTITGTMYLINYINSNTEHQISLYSTSLGHPSLGGFATVSRPWKDDLGNTGTMRHTRFGSAIED